MCAFLMIACMVTLDVSDSDVKAYVESRNALIASQNQAAELELEQIEKAIQATKKVFIDPSLGSVQMGQSDKGVPLIKAPNRRAAEDFKKQMVSKKKEIEMKLKVNANSKDDPKQLLRSTKKGDVAVFEVRSIDINGSARPTGGVAPTMSPNSREYSQLLAAQQADLSVVPFRPKNIRRENGKLMGTLYRTRFVCNDIELDQFDGKLGRIVHKDDETIEIYWFTDDEVNEIRKKANAE
jgi:hypothetical protein